MRGFRVTATVTRRSRWGRASPGRSGCTGPQAVASLLPSRQLPRFILSSTWVVQDAEMGYNPISIQRNRMWWVQELGLRAIEVNPGGERTGQGVMRAVGEATQSSRLPTGTALPGPVPF